MEKTNLPSRKAEALLLNYQRKRAPALLDLRNWRPITLLNVDLKIDAKAIAKRVQTVLSNLYTQTKQALSKDLHW